MDEKPVAEPENTNVLYSAKQKYILEGAWMTWLCKQEEKTGKYIYDIQPAVNHFERKYHMTARQFATMGKKDDIELERVDIPVPEGQIWIR